MIATANDRPVSSQSSHAEKLRRGASDCGLRGWPVLPLAGVTGDLSLATTDCRQISRYWSGKPTANIGLATGAHAGFFALRVIGQAGKEHLDELETRHGPLPRTTTILEPDGTRVLLFSWPVGRSIPSRPKLPCVPLGVAGLDGYVVAPPSVDPFGGTLTWEVSPNHKSPAMAPGWLLDLITGTPAAPEAPADRQEPGTATPDDSKGSIPCRPEPPAAEVKPFQIEGNKSEREPDKTPQPEDTVRVSKEVAASNTIIPANEPQVAKPIDIADANGTEPAIDHPMGQPIVEANEPEPTLPGQEIVDLDVNALRLHPLADRIPPMRDAEWRMVREDILAHGVHDPILVQKGGIVLDGRHRLNAARERGDKRIPVRLVDLTPEEQIKRIYASAIMRRHLSDDQRAVLAVDLEQVLAGEAKQERARKGGVAKNNPSEEGSKDKNSDEECLAPHGGAKQAKPAGRKPRRSRKPRSRDQAAAAMSVSKKKVAKAAALKKLSPDLAEKVLAGELTLAQARRIASGKAGGKGVSIPMSPVDLGGGCLMRISENNHRSIEMCLPDPDCLAYALYYSMGVRPIERLIKALSKLVDKGYSQPKSVVLEKKGDRETFFGPRTSSERRPGTSRGERHELGTEKSRTRKRARAG